MNKAVIQAVGEFLTSREFCFDMLDDGEALVFGINGQNGIWRTVVTTNEDGRVVTFHSLLPARVPVGRRSRCAELLARLSEYRPLDFNAEVKTLFAPAGLDIGSEAPEEIALSIVSEVAAVLSERRGGFLRERKGDIHISVATAGEEAA